MTGSIGKTTAKDALAKILARHFRVQVSPASFNSEFGLPLAILGEPSGFRNPLKWFWILLKGCLKSWRKLDCDFLILELGAEKRGDLAQLLTLIQPAIGITLAVAPVHLNPGQFRSLADVAAEKCLLAKSLPAQGWAILNADDFQVRNFYSKAAKIFFSQRTALSSEARRTVQKANLLRAEKITENLTGLSAEIVWRQERVKLNLPILGCQNLTPILAAIAGGLAIGLKLEVICRSLQDFHLPAGRGNLLAGLNGAWILDSSYNSNPVSAAAALASLARLKITGRKIVVLGQMNELGKNSVKFHQELGQQAAKVADEVLGVFGEAKLLVKSAQRKPAYFFHEAERAANFLLPRVQKGDLILIKGSQNKVRLERLVFKLLANPKRDQRFLCRQNTNWQKLA